MAKRAFASSFLCAPSEGFFSGSLKKNVARIQNKTRRRCKGFYLNASLLSVLVARLFGALAMEERREGEKEE